MVTAVAKLNYLRIAPRKVRMVADLIRGKTVKEAVSLLQFTVRRSAQPVLKLLNSAAANAKHNAKVNPENLVISKITVDQGPILKRSMPRSRGSAFPIQKKISHVYIELSEKKGEKIAKKKKNAK